jgi:diadenosine tetraphosphate (Ap4A) HIT family hydrolase
MDVVFGVEVALRGLLQPRKVNLASLGNQVPHLHWHVVPRFADDSHYPNPVWGAALRQAVARALPPDFAVALAARLADSIATDARR